MGINAKLQECVSISVSMRTHKQHPSPHVLCIITYVRVCAQLSDFLSHCLSLGGAKAGLRC